MRNIYLILFLLFAGVFASKSSAQAVILKADTVEVSCSSTDTFLISVRLDNFTDVSGLQFTLQWDTARLDYAYVTMLHPGFTGAGFDTLPATLQLGRLTFAWTDLNGLTLPPNSLLFQVAFARIGGAQTPVSFANDPTPVIAFDNTFNEIPIETYNGLVRPFDDESPTVACPANVMTSAAGPVPVPGIAPTIADNCDAPVTGWSSSGATIADFPADADASGAVFNLGTSTITYTTTDVGGNTATCSFDIVVEFAISTDDLTLVAAAGPAVSCGENIAVNVTAFNHDSISGLQFSMEWLPTALQFVSVTNLNAGLNYNPGNFETSQTGAGLLAFAWNSTNIFGSTIPDGETLFTLNFIALGSGDVSFGDDPTAPFAFYSFPPEEIPLVLINTQVTVIDATPPAITCPADLTVQSPGTAAVQNIAPTDISDNCANPLAGWSVSGATVGNFPSDPDASGALFNIGASTVTYTATDAGGNTATCSFVVTVEFANNTTDLTIVANSTTASCGSAFAINVTGLNFETVAGAQFTINWDPALFEFTGLSNFNFPIGIDASDFNLLNAGNGALTFAWTSGDLNGSTIANGEVLFTLNFTLLGNTSSTITFGDDPTPRIAFDGGTFDEIPMVTVDGQVTVSDNIPPVISCPPNVTVDAPQGQLSAMVNGLDPGTLTDNCGGTPALSYTQTGATNGSGNGNANGTYNAGTTTVVYTATDANGNTATCSFQVVVDAGMPVVLQLDTLDLGCAGVPSQITVTLSVENFTDLLGLQFGLNWDTAALDLVPPVQVSFLGAGTFTNFINLVNGTLVFFGGDPSWPDIPNGSTLMTLTFDVDNALALNDNSLVLVGPFDAVNNSFQTVPVMPVNGGFIFTIDNTPPVVTCPTDTLLNAVGSDCSVNFNTTLPTATDDCGTIASIVAFPDTSIYYVAAPTVVTYTVTDEAGNTATCAFTVSVFSSFAPQLIFCPPNITVAANSNCEAVAFWDPPIFQETCMDQVMVDNNGYFSGSVFPLSIPDPALVSYTATDLSGNQTTCSFTVTVLDTLAPTVQCPEDTLVTPIDGCNFALDFSIVTADNCDIDLDTSFSHPPGTLFSGITPVTVAVVDDAGNIGQCSFVVIVADNVPPSFIGACPNDTTILSASGNCGANPLWDLPMATDNCDASPSVLSVPAPGTFLVAQVTPHIVTFTATDDLGNTATCTFSITVSDGTPPTLTNCPTLPIIEVLPVDSCTKTIIWTIPTVNDNCGAGFVTLTSNLSPGVFTTGDTTVTYTATDASGNTTTCTFNVSVRDVVPPVFVDCPTQPYLEPDGNPCGVVVNWQLPTGMDNCTPESELVYTSTFDPLDTFLIGTFTFPVRVTDASGNFVECVITIDVDGPETGFTGIPIIPPIDGCETAVTWISPMPVGFCPPITIDSSHASGSFFPFGTTIVTYTATDTSGNVATATFTVVVSESEPPLFDCPESPIVVNLGGVVQPGSDPDGFVLTSDTTAGCQGVELTFDLPAATDNCVTPTVTQLEGVTTGGIFPIGINNLVFRAVDSSGNQTQCAVFIEVVALPELAPTADQNPACAEDDVTITAALIAGATYTWTGNTSTTNVAQIDNLSTANDGLYVVTALVNGCPAGPDSIFIFLPTEPMANNDLQYTIDPGTTISFPSVFLNDTLAPAFDFSICDSIELEGLQINYTDGTFIYTAGEEPDEVSFSYRVCSRTCPNIDDEANVVITIRDTKCSFIPNIFTPNGDDRNDFFEIPCLNTGQFRESSLIVYNQWGDKVYEAAPYSNDPDEAWRGTLDGEPGKDLPDGVYFYIFKPGPNVAVMKGFVEIFR
jgi:gliding motility-associated-like protein